MTGSVRWLTRYDRSGASSRYRVFQYTDHELLGRFEHAVAPMNRWGASPLERVAGVGKRLLDVRRDAAVDVVVVQKELVMPPPLFRIAARAERWSRPVVWDLDDAVWIGRSGARDAAVWMAQRCDVVVAGNELIAEWARSRGASDVVVIPTTFTPSTSLLPTPLPTDPEPGAKLVWIGSPATTPLLDRFTPMIASWFKAVPALRLELVGAGPSELSKLPGVVNTAWSARAEHVALVSADFGLALQGSGGYNDFKCGFKVVQYLSHGVVPIATAGAVHRSILGDAGILLEEGSDSGSRDVIEQISLPPSSEQRALAMQRWRTRFSTEIGASEWATVLDRLV